jgi:hypothetical protein
MQQVLRVLCGILAVGLWPSIATAQVVMAPGAGAEPVVRLLHPDGSVTSFEAYDPVFRGGVRVALGDVNGDGTLDIITAAGPGGGPHVRVLSGVDFSELASFYAYTPIFTGGVFVAAGDVDGDGRADIITGAGPGGGPHVRVLSGANLSELASFYAYTPIFTGGVQVAAGDVDGDGRADIITGAGPGGGPHVRVLSGADLTELASFYAYTEIFSGGVFVASGDIDGDGRADIITGAGPGGGPHVRVLSGADLSEIASFYAYDPAFTGGVSVAAIDFNNDGRPEIITGAGPGGGPHVRVLNGTDLTELESFYAFDPSFSGGVFVGSVAGGSGAFRFTSATSTTFTVGSAGTFAVTTDGGSGTITLTVTGTLPSGVTFTDNHNGTATLAGTPAAGSAGSYPLTFSATVGSGTPVTQPFTLTVNQAPAITSAAATTFTLGAAGTFTVTTTGSPTPTITATGALPAGVTLTDNGNGTATLAGTPAAGTGGTYPITISASNGVGTAATQSFTLTVSGAPTFTSATTATFTVGVAGTFAITTVASPTATLTSSGVMPAGITFTDNGNGTATLSGTPAAGAGGAYLLILTANNSAGSATQNLTLNVRQGPAITSAATTTFTVGSTGNFIVTTTGNPPPALSAAGALPSGVTFTDLGNGQAQILGSPSPGTGGTYTLTITATNGIGTPATQTFTLIVNQSPAITSANTTTFAIGAAGSFTVTAVGTPTPALALSGTLPSGVTFVDNGNGTGTLSGTPAAGTGGSYALTFTAANGVLPNATQAFTLIVNQAPAITSAASATFTVGSANSFTVTTNGFPLPTLAIGGAALPSGVTFVDNGNGTGTLSGTPAAGTGGTYAITFTATNTVGSSAPQAFTLTVNQAPAITSANTTSFTVGSAGSFTVTATGTPTPSLAVSGSLPAGVTFVDNGNGTGTLSGTPAAGTAGSYALTFTASNGVLPNGTQAFTLNVNQPPAITSAASTTFTVGTASSFTVTTTGFPTPTVSQTGTLPTGVTFTPATSVLGGTPTQTGAFPIVFNASNGIPPNATQNFTLNVVCPAITVNPATMPEGLFQVAYPGVTFTQTGSTGSTITWGATGLPAGLVISSTTGVVSGTPTNTVLNGAVVITATDNFGCVGTRSTTITVRPTTDNEIYVNGVGNTQYIVGVTGIATPHVFFNDNVKTGDSGPGTLSVAFNAPASGAVLEGATDGTFIYTPNVAFAGPSDSFTYTLTDGNGVTNTATVTINLSGLVWYVNNSGANGNGQSHSPFNALNNADAPSGPGSFIYVHTGTGTTTGNLTMDTNQTLHGQGTNFTLNGLLIPGGVRPTLGGTLTLANSDAVASVNFAPVGIPAMTATNVTQPLTIDRVGVTGGTTALSLTNVSGAVSVTNATFTNTTGAEVLINQGSGNVDIGATISSNAGRSVDIQNRTGGTVLFHGAIADTGAGIFLNANTGSTISFMGGLTLTTGADPAFTATGGGTVQVCDETPCSPSITGALVNTITTTTGTALNVANTTIGASGLTFRSISANGAANGIVLNSTGTSGGLTVTGNGGVCTSATPTCTGGRIQNTVGADNSTATPVGTGIVLNNTRSVSLSLMRIDNHSNYAIRGTSVDGFNLASSLVDGANGTNVATPFNDGSLVFFGVTGVSSGMTGTSSITNSTIQGGFQRNIAIDNSVGTLNLTVSGNTIRRTSDAAGDDGFFLEADTTATVTLTVSNNTFARHGGDHINVTMVNDAVVDVTITGNTLHGNYTGTPEGNHPIGLGQGIFLFGAAFNGTVTYDVSNNGTAAVPFRGNRQGGAIHVNKGSGTGTFSGRIENNVIGDPAVVGSGSAEAFGIIVGARGAGGSHTTLINNNQIRQYFDRGIVLQAGEGSAALNATVTNNTVSNFADAVNSLHGIHSDNGILATDTNAVCLNISGNSVATAGNEPQGGADIRLRRGSNTTVSIPGLAGTTAADAQARLQALNPTATTITVTGTTFSNIAACQIP